MILHVGTNDAALYEGREIVDILLELKSFIAEQLPTTHIIYLIQSRELIQSTLQ